MRILIAEDDEALARFVRQGLEAESYAVDVLADGEQARQAATENDYDVVVLDLNLPRLDGVAVLRHLRLKKPSLPVLVLTQRTKVEDRVQCLDTGADDYIPKQLSPATLDILHIRNDLIAKLHAAFDSAHRRTGAAPRKPVHSASAWQTPSSCPAIVAIGASTGGPRALQEILSLLPRDLAVPILIVQHMPVGFTAPLAQRLDALCALSVREAAHGDLLQPGVVYIAPAGWHMRVEGSFSSQHSICLDSQPVPDCPHMPSVDVTMKSVAEAFQASALGIILTGMGSDGAEGIKAIQLRGGMTIGQDEASCIVYGMPRACSELGLLQRVVPLSQIPAQILTATRYRRHA